MKNTTVYIFGHKNPDTDSICSSIAYSSLKMKLGYNQVIAGRLGSINGETKYILDYFDVQVPDLIEHVRTQITDISYYEMDPIFPDVSIGTAWKIMMETQRIMIPVADRKTEKLIGIITLGDISRANMRIDKKSLIKDYKPTIGNIAKTLKAKVIFGNLKLCKDNKICSDMIIAMSTREMKSFTPAPEDMIITRSTQRCAAAALKTKAKYIFLIGGLDEYKNIDFSKIDTDKIVFLTNHDIYSSITLLSHSISVSSIMTSKDIIFFSESDFLSDVKKTMLQSKHRNFTIVNDDGKVLGLMTKRHVIDKNKKKVIILDHNEWTQTVQGLEEAEVLEIIDHHRVGDIQTMGPILFRNEPLGSTCTIIAKLFAENGFEPSKQIAGILLSGIISDTLLFKSPTTTQVDVTIANKLAQIAQVDINSFGIGLLKAGASIKGKTIREIINTDLKEYRISNIKLFLSQIFITDINEILELKDDILKYLDYLCQNNNYAFGGLVITDILGSGSHFIFEGRSKEIAQRAFDVKKNSQLIFLPKVVSRKKQILPILSEFA